MLSNRGRLAVLLIFLLLAPMSYFMNSQSARARMNLENVDSTYKDSTPTDGAGVTELGVWHASSSNDHIPSGASWVVAAHPYYVKPRENVSLILNWYSMHPPADFKSEEDLERVEDSLKNVSTDRFWGMIFICEEHYRNQVAFEDNLNTTWFGERLLGLNLFRIEQSSASRDTWQDEMFLRMVRGFYNYFHGRTKVGITACAGSLVPRYRNQSWSKSIPEYFGEPAMVFVKGNYDFVILYAYTRNLEDFSWTREYFRMVDQLFQAQKKFWILTRIWRGENDSFWEREAIGLEMENSLRRNIVVLSYCSTEPPLEETWSLMLRSIQLFASSAPYHESYVYQENLLTGRKGKTYGWSTD